MLAVASATAPPDPPSPPPRLETFHERIVEIRPGADGTHVLGFERSARYHAIDPARSPDAAAMLAFAERARDEGRAVHVTIDATGTPRRKGDAGPLPVIVRLADTPG